MVYRDLILRSIVSFIFFSIYLLIAFFNFKLVFYLVFLIYFLILLEILFYFKNYKILPITYISFSFIFFLLIDFSNKIFLTFNLFILIVIAFDVFSYFTGNLFGKSKLISISPNKTIEGLIGGFLVSLIIAISFAYYQNLKINIELFILIIIIICSAFFGDILESFFKRKNNLKDSSNFIPGHGGVFDRFDSFLFSIIYYSIFVNFYL